MYCVLLTLYGISLRLLEETRMNEVGTDDDKKTDSAELEEGGMGAREDKGEKFLAVNFGGPRKMPALLNMFSNGSRRRSSEGGHNPVYLRERKRKSQAPARAASFGE